MRTLCGDAITTFFPRVSTEVEPYVNKACLLALSQLQRDPQTGWSLWWLREPEALEGRSRDQFETWLMGPENCSCSIPSQAVLLFGRLLPRHDVSIRKFSVSPRGLCTPVPWLLYWPSPPSQLPSWLQPYFIFLSNVLPLFFRPLVSLVS